MKRQLVAILIALSMITMTACNEKTIQEKSQTVESSEATLSSVALETVKIADNVESNSDSNSEKIVPQWKEYNQDTEYIIVNIDKLTDEDKSDLISLTKLKGMYIVSANGSMEEYIEFFKKMNLLSIYIETDTYKDKDFELLVNAFPSCQIRYIQSPEHDVSQSDIKIDIATPLVLPNLETETWECINRSPFFIFRKYCDEDYKLKKAELYYNTQDEWQPVKFTDGNTFLNLDTSFDPQQWADFGIGNSKYNFKEADNGRYKVVTTWSDNTQIPIEFYMCNTDSGVIDFLSERKNAIYEKALDIYYDCYTYPYGVTDNHPNKFTSDELNKYFHEVFTDSYCELLIQQYNGENQNFTYYYEDKNYDESCWFTDFSLIYEDNNQVLFKSTLVHYDSEPYNIWYESRNYHMVKTDDGWKFDAFNLWY